MGESPATVDPEIDPNYRLRRLYYRDAPPAHQGVRLGAAVGASSCVPGLFEPIELQGLYELADGEPAERKINVRLVDGGVHDNQGVVGLFEQDCDVMLISDASGQMMSENNPSRGILGVPLRSNSILMSRVRGAEYQDLVAQRRAGLLNGLMFIHLNMDLEADPVDWIGCNEPHQASEEARPPERRGHFTRYGIRKSVQRLLAGIRTDLDSFNDAEAFALMLSGYRMTEYQFAETMGGFPTQDSAGTAHAWRFLNVEPLLDNPPDDAFILKILQVAKDIPLKVWRLSTGLKILAVLLGVSVLAASAYVAFVFPELGVNVTVTLHDTGIAIIGIGIAGIIGKGMMRIVHFRETIMRILIGIGAAFFGSIIAKIHITFFDRWYLRLGQLENLGEQGK